MCVTTNDIQSCAYVHQIKQSMPMCSPIEKLDFELCIVQFHAQMQVSFISYNDLGFTL